MKLAIELIVGFIGVMSAGFAAIDLFVTWIMGPEDVILMELRKRRERLRDIEDGG